MNLNLDQLGPGLHIDDNQLIIGFQGVGETLEHPRGAVALGFGANADFGGIAIGQNARAGKNGAAFGEGVVAPDGRFMVLNWDLTDVGPRLTELERLVAMQQNLIEEQRGMLETLWYHPGMPGAAEAQISFMQNAQKQQRTP